MGGLLFALKRTLFASALEPTVVRVHASDSKDQEHAIAQAMLVQYALDEGIGASDPVVWERLRAVFPELARDEKTLGRERFERELMRRAHELSLFQEDALLRNRLAFDAETVLKAALPVATPTDGELQRYLAQHRASYAHPASVTFSQLFISRQKHGESTMAVAQRLRSELMAKHLGPDDAASYGEPSNWPRTMTGTSEQVARLFGGTLANGLESAPIAGWSEPVASALGLHLVWLSERTAEAPAALSDVRARVTADYLEQQRDAALREQLSLLRARYRVELEP